MLPAQTKRRRFDVGQFHRMLEAGILSEDDRVELIDGEIVEMTPIGTRHIRAVISLTMLLAPPAAAQGLVLSVQNPLILDEHGEPEPDLTLLTASTGQEAPKVAQALLVVEVCETSLSWDRNVKVPRYARAGISEVWLVDLAADEIEVHTGPQASGGYAAVERCQGEQELTCGALGALGALVRDVL